LGYPYQRPGGSRGRFGGVLGIGINILPPHTLLKKETEKYTK